MQTPSPSAPPAPQQGTAPDSTSAGSHHGSGLGHSHGSYEQGSIHLASGPMPGHAPLHSAYLLLPGQSINGPAYNTYSGTPTVAWGAAPAPDAASQYASPQQPNYQELAAAEWEQKRQLAEALQEAQARSQALELELAHRERLWKLQYAPQPSATAAPLPPQPLHGAEQEASASFQISGSHAVAPGTPYHAGMVTSSHAPLPPTYHSGTAAAHAYWSPTPPHPHACGSHAPPTPPPPPTPPTSSHEIANLSSQTMKTLRNDLDPATNLDAKTLDFRRRLSSHDPKIAKLFAYLSLYGHGPTLDKILIDPDLAAADKFLADAWHNTRDINSKHVANLKDTLDDITYSSGVRLLRAEANHHGQKLGSEKLKAKTDFESTQFLKANMKPEEITASLNRARALFKNIIGYDATNHSAIAHMLIGQIPDPTARADVMEKYLDSESDSSDGSSAWDIDTIYRKIRIATERKGKPTAAAATAAAAAAAATERVKHEREGGGDKTENPCPSCGKVHKGVSSRDCTAHLKTKCKVKNCPCSHGGTCLFVKGTSKPNKVMNALGKPVSDNVYRYLVTQWTKKFPQAAAAAAEPEDSTDDDAAEAGSSTILSNAIATDCDGTITFQSHASQATPSTGAGRNANEKATKATTRSQTAAVRATGIKPRKLSIGGARVAEYPDVRTSGTPPPSAKSNKALAPLLAQTETKRSSHTAVLGTKYTYVEGRLHTLESEPELVPPTTVNDTCFVCGTIDPEYDASEKSQVAHTLDKDHERFIKHERQLYAPKPPPPSPEGNTTAGAAIHVSKKIDSAPPTSPPPPSPSVRGPPPSVRGPPPTVRDMTNRRSTQLAWLQRETASSPWLTLEQPHKAAATQATSNFDRNQRKREKKHAAKTKAKNDLAEQRELTSRIVNTARMQKIVTSYGAQ